MSTRFATCVAVMALIGMAVFMLACGSGGSPAGNGLQAQTGSVVAFGSDAPICDVESFTATITSATLTGGGQSATLISSTSPATVDFARLTDFTNILSTANVATGTYDHLQMALTNPQLTALNTATSPPTDVNVPATLTATTFNIPISPALVVTANNASGLLFDFNLRKSVQVDNSGQVTGTIDPQMTAAATTVANSSIGEADSLYGIIQSVTTSGLPSGSTGSLQLTLHDGTGQTLTVLTNSNTDFEGDGVATFGDLQAGLFVEVDAMVMTDGSIVAQTVDAEEQTSSSSQKSAFLGRVLSVNRDGNGNATSFTLLVEDEIPDVRNSVPLHSGLNVVLTSTTHYFTNWRAWNRAAFTFSPSTLGVAEKVAIFGTLGTGATPTMTAQFAFLRPRNVLGNFSTLVAAGSDNKTGGFTMIPCGALFQQNPITVLTYPETNFTGVSGLTGLTTAPTLNTRGLLFYEQTSGSTVTGASWKAPTWVLQARQVHQLPN